MTRHPHKASLCSFFWTGAVGGGGFWILCCWLELYVVLIITLSLFPCRYLLASCPSNTSALIIQILSFFFLPEKSRWASSFFDPDSACSNLLPNFIPHSFVRGILKEVIPSMPSDEVPRLNTSKLPSIQTNSLLNNSLKNDQPTSYFSPISPVQLPHPTFSSPSKTVGERVGGATTPSILLNRNPSVNANTLSTLMNDAAHMQGVKRYTLVDRGTAPITVAGGNVVGGGGAGEGMKNRIGSPDSSSGYTSSSTTTSTTTATTSSTSDPSQSHLAGGGGTKSSSSPSESVSTLLGVTGLGGRDERGRDKIRDGGPMTMSRSASPHCHFAPLPRVASIGERPASSTSRRGSVSNTATNARTKLVNHGTLSLSLVVNSVC